MAGPRRNFKTEKGTELPLLNLKGKEYLQVAHRLQWFREVNPNGSIETELVRLDVENKTALVRAKIQILDRDLRIMVPVATAYGSEAAKDFPDFLEKAETKAVGRALAMCGFGTQFASDDLDEGTRIVDSPVPSPSAITGTATSNTNSVVNITAALSEATVEEAPVKKTSPFKKKQSEAKADWD